MNTTVRKTLVALLIASTASFGLATPAQAGTGVRDTAQRQLITHGVLPADAQARIAAMTDEEAATLARDIAVLPAGGNPVAAIGGLMVAGAAVAVFVAALPFIIIGGIVFAAIKSGGSSGAEAGPVAPVEQP
jgi:hypothetical protein